MSKFWFIWPLNPFILSSYICERKVRKDYFFGNISFRNDISLKTMKLGVLWWEKLKNRESQGRIVPWAWTSLGVEEQLPAELLIFSSCLSPGRVKKLQMIINFCLKVDHSANLNPSKSTWSQLIIVVWNVQNHNLTSKALGREIKRIRDRSSRDSRHTLLWSNSPRGNEFVRAYYIIAWISNWRRKWHKYVTNQKNVKSLAKKNLFMLGSRATFVERSYQHSNRDNKWWVNI